MRRSRDSTCWLGARRYAGFGVAGFQPDRVSAGPSSTLAILSDSANPSVEVACEISLADKQVGFGGVGGMGHAPAPGFFEAFLINWQGVRNEHARPASLAVQELFKNCQKLDIPPPK